MLWILVKIIILSLVLILFFTAGLLYLNTHPPRYGKISTPDEYNLIYEHVEFTTEDKVKLKGWFLPSGLQNRAPAIIICHGLGASKSDFIGLAAYLVKSGFNVMLFDFRAHGESSGRSCSLGLNEQKDIRAVVEFLKDRIQVDTSRIGIYGFSLGGAVALLYTAKDERIGAVVADSSFSSLKRISAEVMKKAYHTPSFPFINIAEVVYKAMFRGAMGEVNPEKYISYISPRAVLLIASDNDEMIGINHAEALFSAAGEPKDLFVVEGAPHGGTLAFAQDIYFTKVAQFFMNQFEKE